MTFNPVRHAFQTMLADQKYRGLPLLTASDYTPFLTFNAKNRDDCNNKLDIRRYEGAEKDSRGATVFEGSVVLIVVDGYVMAKGRSTSSPTDALLDVFHKVVTLAREYE
ncbi:hypothetical protein J4E90_010398 [Alternaria incomplexa]|uniref:uncharacterized protein n=1 Tax=Alternaria incomplexa TaxID=1187928 RepID=UPI002221219B|nr:uncharacterized protein J4E90_010398 [Alternaria incomplexa]KAI4906505.1 hypothetical protein J4E90_010398 [Alternaria incomplexa]